MLDFPDAPTDGQIFVASPKATFRWNLAPGRWRRAPLVSLLDITPDFHPADGFGHTINATGYGFTAASQITIDGTSVTTGMLSSSSLFADGVTAPTTPITKQIGVTGAPEKLPLVYQVAPPILDRLEPDYCFVGRTVRVKCIGNGFEANSIVVWEMGGDLATTYISAQELQVDCPVHGFADTADVHVRNGTLNSNTKQFEYRPAPPIPTLTSLSPNNVAAGFTYVNVTYTGTGFYDGIPVNHGGGKVITVTVNSSTSMVVEVQRMNPLSQGSYPCNVGEPGYVSNSLNFAYI